MRKLLLFGLFSLILSACSFDSPEGVVSVDALSAPKEETSLENYSFGEDISLGASVASKRFVFIKDSSSAEPAASTVALDSPDGAFYLVSSTGCNRELKKASDKCYVTIKFMKSSEAGTFEGTLSVGEEGSFKTILLSATVVAPLPPDPEQISSILSLKEGSLEVDSSLDFGVLGVNQSLTKILTITNLSSASITPEVSLEPSSNFIKNTDTCHNRAIRNNGTCQIKLTYKASSSAPLENTTYSSILNISGKTVTLQGSMVAAPVFSFSTLKLYENSLELDRVSYGEVQPNAIVTKTLTLKNEGTLTSPPISLTLSGNDKLSLTHTCSALAPNKTCYVKLTLKAGVGSSSSEEVDGTLSIGESSLSVSATVAALPSLSSSLKVFQGTGEVESMDFGQLQGKASTYKIFTVKNIGLAPTSGAVPVSIVGDGFLVSSNTCLTSLKAKTGTCSIKVMVIAPEATASSQNLAGTLFVDEIEVALSATVEAVVPVVLSVSFFESSLEVNSLDFGVVNTGSLMKSVSIVNTGSTTSPLFSAIFSGSDFSVVNGCLNKKLAPSASCLVRIAFSSLQKAQGTYEGLLQVEDKTLTVTASVESGAIVCASGKHLEDDVCVDNTYVGTYPENSMESCEGTLEVSPISCVESWGSQSSVALSFCPSQEQLSPSGLKVLDVDGGTKVVSCQEGSTTESFVSLVCNSGFQEQGEDCVPGATGPLGIAGAFTWLKADSITGVSNGAVLTTWVDSSGKGNDAVQNNATFKPTYSTTGTGRTFPAVVANSSGATHKFMTISSPLPQEATVFVVMKNTGASILTGFADDSNPRGNPLASAGFYQKAGVSFAGSSRSLGIIKNTGSSYEEENISAALNTASNAFNVVSLKLDGTNGNLSSWSNSVLTALNMSYSYEPSKNLITHILLASAQNYSSNMEVSELVIFERLLSNEEIQSVEGYLKTKFNISFVSPNAIVTNYVGNNINVPALGKFVTYTAKNSSGHKGQGRVYGGVKPYTYEIESALSPSTSFEKVPNDTTISIERFSMTANADVASLTTERVKITDAVGTISYFDYALLARSQIPNFQNPFVVPSKERLYVRLNTGTGSSSGPFLSRVGQPGWTTDNFNDFFSYTPAFPDGTIGYGISFTTPPSQSPGIYLYVDTPTTYEPLSFSVLLYDNTSSENNRQVINVYVQPIELPLCEENCPLRVTSHYYSNTMVSEVDTTAGASLGLLYDISLEYGNPYFMVRPSSITSSICSNVGGIWDGQWCQMSYVSKETCLSSGFFWLYLGSSSGCSDGASLGSDNGHQASENSFNEVALSCGLNPQELYNGQVYSCGQNSTPEENETLYYYYYHAGQPYLQIQKFNVAKMIEASITATISTSPGNRYNSINLSVMMNSSICSSLGGVYENRPHPAGGNMMGCYNVSSSGCINAGFIFYENLGYCTSYMDAGRSHEELYDEQAIGSYSRSLEVCGYSSTLPNFYQEYPCDLSSTLQEEETSSVLNFKYYDSGQEVSSWSFDPTKLNPNFTYRIHYYGNNATAVDLNILLSPNGVYDGTLYNQSFCQYTVGGTWDSSNWWCLTSKETCLNMGLIFDDNLGACFQYAGAGFNSYDSPEGQGMVDKQRIETLCGNSSSSAGTYSCPSLIP